MKKSLSFTTNQLQKTAAQSSKMEGLNFARAKKNKAAIVKLKRYGRAITV